MQSVALLGACSMCALMTAVADSHACWLSCCSGSCAESWRLSAAWCCWLVAPPTQVAMPLLAPLLPAGLCIR